MRTLLAASLVLVSGIAAADPELAKTLTIGAGEEQIGSAAQGTVGANGLASYRASDDEALSTVEAKAATELRSGSTGTEAAASVEGRGDIAYRVLPELPIASLWANAQLGVRPGLDARRDVARAAYAGAGAGFKLAPLFARTDGTIRGGLAFAIGGSLEAQDGAERATYTFDFDLYFRCRTRPDGPARCLHVIDTYATGVSGGSQAVVSTIYAARWTGLDLGVAWGDVALGVITDTGTLSIENTETGMKNTVMTEDLPTVERGAWDAGLATMLGPIEVDARTRRSGYVSLDGDLSIEDRVALTAVLPLAARARLSATGFAARTTWWTSKADPGRHAATGGGELAVDLQVHRFDVHAGAGLARSFYPVLDGSAADHPGLGFRSVIHVGRAIDL